MWSVKVGRREIPLCGSLVSQLVTGQVVELQRLDGERQRINKDGSRTELLSSTDVRGITPIRGLTPTECAEHGVDCP